MKISDAVARLSLEEREQFKDLIEECLQREQDIQNNYEQSNESLEKFVESVQKIHDSISTIKNGLDKVKQELLITKAILDGKNTDHIFN